MPMAFLFYNEPQPSSAGVEENSPVQVFSFYMRSEMNVKCKVNKLAVH